MKNLKYFSVIILVVSIYFLFKAITLFNVVKDGDGIGITLFGLELNDRVPYEQVAQYSWSFLIIGAILIIISVITHYKFKTYKVS